MRPSLSLRSFACCSARRFLVSKSSRQESWDRRCEFGATFRRQKVAPLGPDVLLRKIVRLAASSFPPRRREGAERRLAFQRHEAKKSKRPPEPQLRRNRADFLRTKGSSHLLQVNRATFALGFRFRRPPSHRIGHHRRRVLPRLHFVEKPNFKFFGFCSHGGGGGSGGGKSGAYAQTSLRASVAAAGAATVLQLQEAHRQA